MSENWRDNVVWFNTVGVVRVRNKHETKYFIKEVKGQDEFSDYTSILNWGSKFPPLAGEILFKEVIGS